jgi:exopolyphosphatase/guanosine-5'-triphosphate,3'-diphosphate pyrophosphatase
LQLGADELFNLACSRRESSCIHDRVDRIERDDKVIATETTIIPVRESIDRDPNGNIPENIVQQLTVSLREMQKTAEKQGQVTGYIAGATDAFRVANNGQAVLTQLSEELGIATFLLSQDEEAVLGYDALRAEGLLAGKEDALIWENGGGSTQISRKWEGELQSYHLALGKVPMKNYLIQSLQGKELSQNQTPNPISREEAGQAIAWIKTGFQDAPAWVKGNGQVLGIGAMFSDVQKGLGKATFTKGELWQLIEQRIGKTDQELSPNGDPNVTFMLSDLLFLYGAMEALGMDQVARQQMQGPGSTSGLLVDSSKWDDQL